MRESKHERGKVWRKSKKKCKFLFVNKRENFIFQFCFASSYCYMSAIYKAMSLSFVWLINYFWEHSKEVWNVLSSGNITEMCLISQSGCLEIRCSFGCLVLSMLVDKSVTLLASHISCYMSWMHFLCVILEYQVTDSQRNICFSKVKLL